MAATHSQARGRLGAPETAVLQIEDLGVSYFVRSGTVPAVPQVSLTIHRGESVGLVGESGCGKTTVAMAVMRYLGRNGRIVRGRVRFEGRDMAALAPAELRRIRGSEIAMVYQEPMSALNPCMPVGFQLMEVPMEHEGASRKEAQARAVEILGDVNMPDPEAVMRRYPHQLSGGQQQRVVIAMAFLSNPSLLVLDEPTTALDVTVEASVVDLIADLRRKYGTSLLYISHNLGLIVKVCDRVCVMYSGEVVEEGTIHEVFAHTRHPYTRGLLECIPDLDADKRSRPLVPIPGQLALPHERAPGAPSALAATNSRRADAIEARSKWNRCRTAPRTGSGAGGGGRSGALPHRRLPLPTTTLRSRNEPSESSASTSSTSNATCP